MGSATVTSETFPVRLPSGSPLARALASGAGNAFRSASVIGTGAAAGARRGRRRRCGAAAGGGVAEPARPREEPDPGSRPVQVAELFFSWLFFSWGSFPPDRLAQKAAVQHANDPNQAHGDAHQHHDHAAAHTRHHAETGHADQEAQKTSRRLQRKSFRYLLVPDHAAALFLLLPWLDTS